MCVIYEKEFQPGEPRVQFSSCCGASDKGLEDYVGCRGCYQPVERYLRAGSEAEMQLVITDKKVRERFRAMLAEPSFASWREWHDWKIASLEVAA